MGVYLKIDGISANNPDPVWAGWIPILFFGDSGSINARGDTGMNFTAPRTSVNADLFAAVSRGTRFASAVLIVLPNNPTGMGTESTYKQVVITSAKTDGRGDVVFSFNYASRIMQPALRQQQAQTSRVQNARIPMA